MHVYSDKQLDLVAVAVSERHYAGFNAAGTATKARQGPERRHD